MGDERDRDAGDPQPSARRTKRGFKRRVTLTLETEPLLLPGETAASAPVTRQTGELVLPPQVDDADARATTIPPPPELGEGEDAWSRQRPVATSRPAARPTTVPPIATEDDGGALDLVDKRSRPSSPTIDLTAEMLDRYALGDYTAALRIAELILGREPEHESAGRIAKSARDRLGQLYLSRLGALSRVPHVAVDASEIRWLGLDHRAAFLLSRIDGVQSLSDVLDVSGMSRVEALKTLVELLDMGAIGLSD